MQRLNFRFKILIYFTIAAILPCLLFWLFTYNKIDQKIVQDNKNVSYRYILEDIKEINNFFEGQTDSLNKLAQAYTYTDKSPESLKAFLMKQAEINDDFADMYIIKSTGELISSTGEILEDKNYTALKEYVNTNEKRKFLWLESYMDVVNDIETIGITMPLFNKDEQLEGVIVAKLNYNFLKRTLEEIEHVADSDIFLIDAVGDIIFTTNSKYNTYRNIKDDKFILQHLSTYILNTKEGNHDIEFEKGTTLCTFAAINAIDLKVVAISDSHSLIEKANIINKDIYGSITLIGLITIFIITMLSLFLSNSISIPMILLRDGVKELAKGNMEHNIKIERNDEIGEVADTFNQMSYSLKKSYEDLFKRTEELYNKNESLQEMNSELEASYEQLGATMEQLNESEEKFRKLVNNISDVVFVLNNDAEVVYVNNVIESVIGQPGSTLIGKTMNEIMGNELNKSTLEACYANDYYEFQLKMTKQFGKILYMEGSTRRLVEGGNVVGIQAIVRDITQRKLMEDRLKIRYNELKAINNVSEAVTGTLDLDKQLEIVVSQLMEMTDTLCAVIALLEKDGSNDLVVKAAKGMHLENISCINIDATDVNISKIMQNRKPYIVEMHDDGGFHNEYFSLLYKEEGARFILFTPLIAHHRLIGAMSTYMKNKPSQELIELISSMGSSVALSIDNARAYEHVKVSYLKTVQSLISAIEAKDIYTESHSIRVAKYATFLASEMNLDKNVIEDIWVAGVLHDIGKIGISDSILNKKDKLTKEEYDLIKQHPGIAYKILSNIGLNQNIMYAVRHHHERYDGKGYPDGLSGKGINYMASIISIADAFDAITSDRSYRTPRTIEEGIAELSLCKGTQFNTDIVDVFCRAYEVKPELFYKIYRDEDIRFF
ncbi:MAG: HD domain-containing phosphohydrolase [Lutisporaceae bacterium]